MAEPTTPNLSLIVPNQGDLVDTWGIGAINPNMGALDGILGGVANLNMSGGVSVTLSTSGGAPAPGAGPYQAANAVLRLTGALTGNAWITLPVPGRYVVQNRCTGNNTYVVGLLSAAGSAGRYVFAPPGTCTVFCDGGSVFYCDLGNVGEYLDLPVQAQPPWIVDNPAPPFYLCDSTVRNMTADPVLGEMLGARFGGDGVNTFGVPDFRGRMCLYQDPGTGRVTPAGSGITASVTGQAGGSELMQSHNHAASTAIGDPGHDHSVQSFNFGGGQNVGSAAPPGAQPTTVATSRSGTGVYAVTSIAANGGGNSQNMPPVLVGGMRFIRTSLC